MSRPSCGSVRARFGSSPDLRVLLEGARWTTTPARHSLHLPPPGASADERSPREHKQHLDIRSVLATDCGSTTTKAILIEKVDGVYRQTFRGEAPTTVEAPFEDAEACPGGLR